MNESENIGIFRIKMDHIKHSVQFLSLSLSMFSIYKARENSMTTQKKIACFIITWCFAIKPLKNQCFLIRLKFTFYHRTVPRYTPGGFVWCDGLFYLVKYPQEKWACDFHDDAPPLSFQLQAAEVSF